MGSGDSVRIYPRPITEPGTLLGVTVGGSGQKQTDGRLKFAPYESFKPPREDLGNQSSKAFGYTFNITPFLSTADEAFSSY